MTKLQLQSDNVQKVKEREAWSLLERESWSSVKERRKLNFNLKWNFFYLNTITFITCNNIFHPLNSWKYNWRINMLIYNFTLHLEGERWIEWKDLFWNIHLISLFRCINRENWMDPMEYLFISIFLKPQIFVIHSTIYFKIEI